jgi:hypothetical protein
MAITTLDYAPSIKRRLKPIKLDYELLEAATTLVEEAKAVESVNKVLEHLFPGAAIPDLATTAFSFVQGSSRVSVKIDGDELVIAVPLVRLPTGGSAIAALRYVLTRIAGNGQVHHPRLRGDDIYIEFRDKLSRMHPAKVLEVLKRIAFQADAHDDYLIGQFSAQPLERAPIGDVTDEEAARAEALWKQHWADVEELLKESQKKRSMFFLNEVTAYAVYRIGYAIPLGGMLQSKLSEAANTFNDGDEDPTKRETVLAKAIKEMKAVSGAELRKNLGHLTYAITPLGEGKPDVISDYFGGGNYIETLEKLRDTAKHLDAALGMIGTYNYLLARFTWPEAVIAELEAGLAAVAGKPFKEAAAEMIEHGKALAKKFGQDEDDDDDDDEDEGDDDDDGDEVVPASGGSDGGQA